MKFVGLLIAMALVSSSYNIGEGKTHEQEQMHQFKEGNNYIPMDKAILQFENMYGMKVNLPEKLPFDPTYRFGHLDDEGRLKLHYLRLGKTVKNPTRDFIFYVMPAKELETYITSKDEVYTLNNGETAFYRQYHPHFHTFTFSKHRLGYIFGANSGKMDVDSFIEVAQSIK